MSLLRTKARVLRRRFDADPKLWRLCTDSSPYASRLESGLSVITLALGLGLMIAGPTLGAICPEWKQLFPSRSPSPRHGHEMVHDSFRHRVVLFGGFVEQVPQADAAPLWEYDGNNWIPRHEKGPIERFAQAMAYDPKRREIVLFGGLEPFPSGRGLNDTWTWDGVRWQQKFPATSPRPLFGAKMAYDSARDVLVMFGSETFGAFVAETWEWNGEDWRRQSTPDSPGPGYSINMVYDAKRKVTVLHYGPAPPAPDLQTWEYNGSNWTKKYELTIPPGSTNRIPNAGENGLVFDSLKQRVLLFNPYTEEDDSPSEVWEWSGSSWTPYLLNGLRPRHRFDSAVAYDSSRGVAVLFGGWTAKLNDTWQWPSGAPPAITRQPTNQTVNDCALASFSVTASGQGALFYQWRRNGIDLLDDGRAIRGARTSLLTVDASSYGPGIAQFDVLIGDDCGNITSAAATLTITPRTPWSLQLPVLSPSPRYGHAMAYDPVRKVVVLFGGTDGVIHSGETWEYNGTNWHKVAAVGPEPRSGHAMAFMPDGKGGGHVVLFAGKDNDRYHRDTWLWDGAVWVNKIAQATPDYRHLHAMVYDPNIGRIVLFGGSNEDTLLNDAWTWDGNNWNLVNAGGANPNLNPFAREGHVMAFDEVSRRIVLHGGQANLIYFGDTWAWNHRNDTWERIDGGNEEAIGYRPAMAFDSAQGKLRLFGGENGTGYSANTYEWAPPHWNLVASDAPAGTPGGPIFVNFVPSARTDPVMVYDAAHRQMVLFGGRDAEAGGFIQPVGDTWAFRFACIRVLEQPAEEQCVVAGEPLVISVFAAGAEPLSFQWRKDGVNLRDDGRIIGVTTERLAIKSTVASDSGNYDVIVTGPDIQSISSRLSTVRVIAPENRFGFVSSWGWNSEGQLGDGTTTTRVAAVQPPALSNIVSLAGGAQHSLALKRNGQVLAWGNNTYGQLGNGSFAPSLEESFLANPGLVTNLASVVAVAAGDYHSLALRCDGTVWYWGGLNAAGGARASPFQVTNLTDVIALAGGALHSLALKANGTVWAWGQNGGGQLGDGTSIEREEPLPVDALNNIVAVAAGAAHNLALANDGSVWAWGLNDQGQLGDGTRTLRNRPVPVRDLRDVSAIAAGGSHSLALKRNGQVWSWGANDSGQLGLASVPPREVVPKEIAGLSNIVAIAAGFGFSAAVTASGQLWTWGANSSGQLAIGSIESRSVPTLVPAFTNAFAIAAGNSSGYALVGLRGFLAQPPIDPVRITIDLKAGGFELRWNRGGAVLEQADSVLGPWTSLPAASSPFPVETNAGQRFFRLRVP